jgi:hypothetical protein
MSAVFQAFLHNMFAEARALAEKSDVLRLTPLPPFPPCGYICEFDVAHLCRQAEGVVTIQPGPVVAAVLFPEDYLHSTDPRLYLKVASVLEPRNLVHPNIRGGVVCLGSAFMPGTPITALLWELYDIVSGQNVTLDERNAMNPEACRLLRAQPELLAQLQPKPFLRRRHKLQIKVEIV